MRQQKMPKVYTPSILLIIYNTLPDIKITKIGILIGLMLIHALANGQEPKSAKLIKSNGNYIHKPTAMVFPEQIEDYKRKSIYSFTKTEDNIDVTYEKPGSASVAINIYPAGSGNEGRLRNEYLKSLQAISNKASKIIGFEQGPVRRVGSQYICNGFKATSNPNNKQEVTHLILYECGTWFLKMTIVSKNLNNNDPIEALEELFLNKYDPTTLTGLKLLNLQSDFLVAPGLGKDRIRAKYIMSSGFKKLEWANTHVPENERVSGFPDLYLDMHIEAFRELAKGSAADSVPTNDIGELIAYVNLVIKAGYLPEFIMKQYKMIMIVPDDMKLDFESYEQFTKDQNNFSIDLNKHYYLIRYPEQK